MISLQEQANLTTLYSQPWRRYHNIVHINDCMTELETFWDAGTGQPEFTFDDFQIVETAIWYHDAVYNPYSKRNEERSAYLVIDCLLSRVGKSEKDFIIKVNDAIVSTKYHLTDIETESSIATKVMMDIDLSGLGNSWEQYDTNSQNIMDEYYNSSEEEIIEGRLAFLTKLNKKEHFYYTSYFRHKYEVRARENVNREIDILRRTLSEMESVG